MAARIDSSDSDYRIPPEQLRELYARHRRDLYHFFQLRRPAEAEDLVQCVFLEALRYRPHEAITRPLQYLYGIASNVLRDHYRRSKRDQSRYTSTDPHELESIAQNAGAWFQNDDHEPVSAGTELMERAFKEITCLPRSCQIAFIRSHCDGRTYQEIAEELKVTPHAVKKYIIKTLAHLRIQLRKTAP